ncbi:hypothetical protein AWV79_15905 [Cupriavidus sp. UYMMa02A]|uniref:hypothetical protein n=1 Tax=Cupriavidus sp. H39 TaxID=3401635 RepID=UPI00086CB308|nr:hypothetical protein AWV79_15905 [Cupriavidus sp. UYMMa02A]
MKKPMWIAVGICLLITLAACIGSTGLGYADYRPLRYRDCFALAAAWLYVIVMFVKDRRASRSGVAKRGNAGA